MKMVYAAQCGCCRVLFDVQGEVYSLQECQQTEPYCDVHTRENGQGELIREASLQLCQPVPRYYYRFQMSQLERRLTQLRLHLLWTYGIFLIWNLVITFVVFAFCLKG